MESIGRNIAYFRKKAGLTQEELSEKMNVTAQAVSKWENDQSYPDLPCAKKLAQVLRVSTDELFDGERSLPVETDADEARISRRFVVIRVETDENVAGTHVDVHVRFPASVILKAYENGTLGELIGSDAAASHMGMVVGMIKESVLGTLVDVQADGASIQISVEDYEV